MAKRLFVSTTVLFGALSFAACGGGSGGSSSQGVTGASSTSSSSGHGQSSSSSGGTSYKFTTVDAPGPAPTTVNGINNLGEVVGFTSTAVDGGNVNANFLRKVDGTFKMLAVGDPAGAANAANQSDEVVGQANGAAFVLMAGGTPMPLSPFGATSSAAFGVNDTGTVVGQYMKDATHSPGFIDVAGTFTSVTATTASVITFVQGINAAGVAIGFYSEDGTTQHGFTYNAGSKQITMLPDPSTSRTAGGLLVLNQFLGINAGKMTVGYYQTKDGSQYGFLFDLASMTYTFLDHPMAAPVNGVQITQITGISDAGVICGFFVDGQGAQHGFIATP
jgi:hypothetical protein